jgi:hypothetical protein
MLQANLLFGMFGVWGFSLGVKFEHVCAGLIFSG